MGSEVVIRNVESSDDNSVYVVDSRLVGAVSGNSFMQVFPITVFLGRNGSDDNSVIGYSDDNSGDDFFVSPHNIFIGSDSRQDYSKAISTSIDNQVNNSVDNQVFNFKTPDFIGLISSSTICGVPFDKNYYFMVSCPDVLAEEIISLAENINFKLESNNSGKTEYSNSILDDIFNATYKYVTNDYLSNNPHIDFGEELSFIFDSREDNFIMRKFAEDSLLGELFFQRVVHSSLSDSLNRLAVFVIINEMINHYLVTGENLSLRKIFPGICDNKIFSEESFYYSVGVKYFYAHSDYKSFVYNAYSKFMSLDFVKNEYTEKLAFFMMGYDVLGDISLTVPRLTIEAMMRQDVSSQNINSVYSLLTAHDFTRLLNNFEKDQQGDNKYSHNGKTTVIDENISFFVLHVHRKFLSFQEKKLPENSILSRILNDSNESVVYNQLSKLAFCFRDYLEELANNIGDTRVNRLKSRFTEYYMLLVYSISEELNEDRNVDALIPTETIVTTSFIIAFIEFLEYYNFTDFSDNSSHKDNDNHVLSRERGEYLARSILSTDNFCANLTFEEVIIIAEKYVESQEKIPINLLRNTIFTNIKK